MDIARALLRDIISLMVGVRGVLVAYLVVSEKDMMVHMMRKRKIGSGFLL